MLVYLDDILVLGKSPDDMLKKLEQSHSLLASPELDGPSRGGPRDLDGMGVHRSVVDT